jgi:non-heme chloroperoxidase
MDDGVGLHVVDVGEGPAVLLIHAWSMSSEAWDRQVRVLASSGYRVLAYDLRGFGASDKPWEGYGIERLTSDAGAVLDEAGIESAAVVGWSLGGLIALRLAVRSPERVSRLVLLSSTGVSASRTEDFPFGAPADIVEEAQVQGLSENRVAFARMGTGDLFAERPDDEMLDWLQRITLQSPSWSLIATMRTLLHTDQTELLDGVVAPTTQLIGTLDPFMELDAARWVQERLGSTLIEFECGHHPHLELPDAFDETLLSVLGS